MTGLTALQKRFAAITDTRKLLGQVALLGVREAKLIVTRKTGNLGRTIRIGTISETSAQILAGGQGGVGYAQAVEFGTGPHVIVPRKARVLAWGGDRRLSGSLRTGAKATHFAHRVNHPGSRAKPYLMPGAKVAVEKAGLGNTIVTAWNGAA
jgi:hypothetical protein